MKSLQGFGVVVSAAILFGGAHLLFGWEMLSLSSPDHLGFQGWRWHSLSILYELSCLKNSSYFYANKCYNCFRRCSSSDAICFQQCKKTCHRDSQIVHKALHHIWDWNWKTFVLVEKTLFFPWLRSLQVKSAYEGILSELEKERQRVVDVSSNKQQQSHSSPQHSFFSRWQDKFANIVFQPWFLWKDRSKQRESSSTASVATCKKWKADIEQQYQELFKTYRLVTLLHDLCDQYFDHERKWLLPKISALVPVREQKKFNNRVLRFLGYATCRLQLVVLDESLKCRHPEEWRQFRSQVPKPVRLLIPYWKRRHYKQMHRHMCILGP
jgi:hypothetical protein